MLSGRLVHLIETHWEEVVSRTVTQIRRDPQLTHYRAIVEAEMREWGQVLLRNLGHWLAAGKDKEEEIAHNYERLGRLRFEDGIPLHEAVRCLALVREQVLDYVEEQIDSKTSLELYEEEELDRRLGRFFDLLIIHMVKGYEEALRRQLTSPKPAAGSHGANA
jgi:hypothetical protein